MLSLPESESLRFFGPFGAECLPTFFPRLTAWAAVLRRFAAGSRLIRLVIGLCRDAQQAAPEGGINRLA